MSSLERKKCENSHYAYDINKTRIQLKEISLVADILWYLGGKGISFFISKPLENITSREHFHVCKLVRKII